MHVGYVCDWREIGNFSLCLQVTNNKELHLDLQERPLQHPEILNFELEEGKYILWVRYMDIWVAAQVKTFTTFLATGCSNVT